MDGPTKPPKPPSPVPTVPKLVAPPKRPAAPASPAPAASPPARPTPAAPAPKVSGGPGQAPPSSLRRAPAKVAGPGGPAIPPGISPELDVTELAELDRLASQMKQMDYFEILRVPRTASPAEIKAAFYRWSRTYHPDRFYHLPEGKLKEQVQQVFKRITESYYFLRDDTNRTKYLADVTGPERAQKLRFTDVSEVEAKAAKKKEHQEQIGTHPKGRQFFQTGMGDFESGRWSAAARNFKMALTYEPQNPRYKEKLAESQQKEYEEVRAKGAHFKIT